MNNQTHLEKAASGFRAMRNWRLSAVSWFCTLIALLSFELFAQDAETDAVAGKLSDEIVQQQTAVQAEPVEAAPVSVFIPDARQIALALSSQGSRQGALLDIAAAASVLKRIDGDVNAALEAGVNHAALAQVYLDDRAWLQMLVDRYGWQSPGLSVLDPAAWLVLQELQQHESLDVSLVLPGHLSENELMDVVFQRLAERIAAANLPAFLLLAEINALSTWSDFHQLSGADELADPAWKGVEDAWFRQYDVLADSAAAGSEDRGRLDISELRAALSRQVMSAVEAAPPDPQELRALSRSLLESRLAEREEPGAVNEAQVRSALYLASLVDGLHEGRYFDFVQGLLTVTTQLLELPRVPERSFWLVEMLVEELPTLSAHYAVEFGRIDSRLNAALEAAFEVLQNIAGSPGLYLVEDDSGADVGEDQGEGRPDLEPDAVIVSNTRVNLRREHIIASRARLADAVAQLALMIPDMAYYFDTPVRKKIVEDINICISIAASQDDSGGSAILRRQFDGCMETLLQMADQDTRSAELSGNFGGPFTMDALGRELSVTPWQRINYGIGYLHEHYPNNCQPPARPLPNPLEYSVLATTMSWFAGHAPAFAASPENEARLARMRDIGEQLVLDMVAQVECLAGQGGAVNDPVSRGMTEYELALRELNAGIKNAEVDFREQRLSPGADVLLEQDAMQRTSYRPDGLTIGSCDLDSVCEMSGELSTTRALIGLFPNEFLLAEQTGMGSIDMCYRNMEWVNRRSELVRADDDNVSNYYGRLGFDLVGRFSQGENTSDVFAFRFTSPEEHHYLFAQTSEEVLADGCPMSWVGSRVVTPLRESRFGIVPDRLTYLAASRMLPSRLLQGNWDRGAEWRDWFVTGLGVSAMPVEGAPDIMIPLNQHLQSLFQAEQAEIYRRMLLVDSAGLLDKELSLFEELQQVSITKALMRMQMILFYPGSLLESDSIRSSIAGDEGLLDSRVLRRFRQDNLPMYSVNEIALARLNSLRTHWSVQPQTVRRMGSMPVSLMNAMIRVNSLYHRLFVAQPEPLQETEAVNADSTEPVESLQDDA